MSVSNLKPLIGKLNTACRKSLESAAGLCLSHTHYDVELEHFFLKLLDIQNTDVNKILAYCEINESHLIRDLTDVIEQFKTGNTRTPALSPRIPEMIKEAWLVASLSFQVNTVRSGHILICLLSNAEMARGLFASSPLFKKISVETLTGSFADLTAGSIEETEEISTSTGSAAGVGTGDPAPMGGGKGQALAQYTVNLTDKAKKGEIDPVTGRDEEIRQMVDILIRRRQNNPILTGEAGVGKTAVVEGFALRITEGDVPPPLRGVAIHTLDLALLQAGASIKGEFEERLKQVINEVKGSPVPIILFIDEAHTLIGAGGQGAGDAANLLKPALARGELRTIAATTWAEYKKYFEKDAALARRFQVVKVDEPDEAKAMVMMRAIAPFIEKHHNVMITDAALADSVHLSHRFITGRQLPDKSVSVLDTACARVAIGLTTSPAQIEDATRKIGQIDREVHILEKEVRMGQDHSERILALGEERRETEVRLEELTKKWKAEMAVAEKVLATREEINELYENDPDDPGLADKQQHIRDLDSELTELQGDEPLVQVSVDAETISQVISGWTGIPTGKMLVDEAATVMELDKFMGERLIGQDHGLAAIAKVIQTAHAGIEDPSKPTGVFMLVGPSGVGKTECALTLADLLYGGEENVITINMSEYQEAHTVSSLKGSPPGYVGYGEGGVLTEAVRRKPYSVVLLDEVEKAHSDVMELFYQVFDKGMLEDGEGRRIDFKNTLIILTSNLGTNTIMKLSADEETKPDADALAEVLRPELQAHFKPAFLGRMKVIPFYPIMDENLRKIVRLKLNKVVKRMATNRGTVFTYGDDVVEAIASRCTEVDSGARNIDHIMSNSLMPEMSREILSRMAVGEEIETVNVTMDGDGFKYQIY
jgi:type VI secretion system protein VasG